VTCEQFDEMWRRLDSTTIGSELLIPATGAEIKAFEQHIIGCGACRTRSLERWKHVQSLSLPERVLLEIAADKRRTEMREQERYDEELR
jgi:hypothetical protein